MLAPATNLPDPFVRLAPDLSEMIPRRPLQIDVECAHSSLSALTKVFHHFAIVVELELIGCGIADAHRFGALVSPQPRQLQFGQPSFSVDGVHDLDLLRTSRDGSQ